MRKKIISLLLLGVLTMGLISCDRNQNSDFESQDTGKNPYLNYPTVSSKPYNTIFETENRIYTISNEIKFTDLQKTDESGHLGHAMVEYADGCILAFYPRCNGDNAGHSGRGWMEYKRSTDYGKTWSKPMVFEHSQNVFRESDGRKSVMCEKGVRAADGTIVLFLLNCDVESTPKWEPYYEPEVILSHDQGESWSEPYPLSDMPGRVYDAKIWDNEIYVLVRGDGGVYCIYKSSDNGQTFVQHGSIVNARQGSYYGTMERLPDGRLILYIYHEASEKDLQYFISANQGKTWIDAGTAHFAKKIRNPQLVCYNDAFFCFGRSGGDGAGNGHFLIYCSIDGINWDDGQIVKSAEYGAGAYSNTLVVGNLNEEVTKTLIVQSSHAYKANFTEVYMWEINMFILKNQAK